MTIKPRCRHCGKKVPSFGDICPDCDYQENEVWKADQIALQDRATAEDY